MQNIQIPTGYKYVSTAPGQFDYYRGDPSTDPYLTFALVLLNSDYYIGQYEIATQIITTYPTESPFVGFNGSLGRAPNATTTQDVLYIKDNSVYDLNNFTPVITTTDVNVILNISIPYNMIITMDGPDRVTVLFGNNFNDGEDYILKYDGSYNLINSISLTDVLGSYTAVGGFVLNSSGTIFITVSSGTDYKIASVDSTIGGVTSGDVSVLTVSVLDVLAFSPITFPSPFDGQLMFVYVNNSAETIIRESVSGGIYTLSPSQGIIRPDTQVSLLGTDVYLITNNLPSLVTRMTFVSGTTNFSFFYAPTDPAFAPLGHIVSIASSDPYGTIYYGSNNSNIHYISITAADPHILCLDGSRLDVYKPGSYLIFYNGDVEIIGEVICGEEGEDKWNRIILKRADMANSITEIDFSSDREIEIDDNLTLIVQQMYSTIALKVNRKMRTINCSGLLAGRTSTSRKMKEIIIGLYAHNAIFCGSQHPHVITFGGERIFVEDGYWILFDDVNVEVTDGKVVATYADRLYVNENAVIKTDNYMLRIQDNGAVSIGHKSVPSVGLFTGQKIRLNVIDTKNRIQSGSIKFIKRQKTDSLYEQIMETI